MSNERIEELEHELDIINKKIYNTKKTIDSLDIILQSKMPDLSPMLSHDFAQYDEGDFDIESKELDRTDTAQTARQWRVLEDKINELNKKIEDNRQIINIARTSDQTKEICEINKQLERELKNTKIELQSLITNAQKEGMNRSNKKFENRKNSV